MPKQRERFFTDTFIQGLKRATLPYKRSETAPRGEGRLIVRVLPSGSKEFFYRYRKGGGDKTLSLGKYGEGRTLKAIRAESKKLVAQQLATGDVKEHRKAERQRQQLELQKGTFGQLLNAYVQNLRDQGKVSAAEAEGVFKRHVIEPFPSIIGKRAEEVDSLDIQMILARMVKAGVTRQVNVARSYLKAAFSYGWKQDFDPRTVAKDGVKFALKGNPVDAIKRIQEYERAGERTLTDAEVREYWKGLEALPPIQRATLRLNLALCQQRPTQLIRASWPDFDFQQNTLLLRDTKGRGAAREHLLPLSSLALAELKTLRQFNEAGGASPFSSDGKRPMVVETLSHAVSDVCEKLKGKKIQPFSQRDLRRTAETMLQKLGVDREVRAHLLSHGRSQGIQGKHYERYDFLKEKLQALTKWAAHLERIIEGKAEDKIVRLRSA